MKRICMGLIAIAFVFLISQVGEAQITGQTLVDGWKEFQRTETKSSITAPTYTEGFYTGFVIGVSELSFYSGKMEFPSGASNRQSLNVVGKYLDIHPERWHEPAAVLVLDALKDAFPTKKK